MRVVVDTPIWSLALRRRRQVLEASQRACEHELTELIKDGNAVLLGVVRQEVLSGIRGEASFERLRSHLRRFLDEKILVEDYEEAARFHNRCRVAGVAGSTIDLLICAVAVRLNATIFTTDRDFENYSQVLPVRLHASHGSKS